NINISELLSIYDNESTISETARKYCEKHNIEYNDSVRRRFSKILNKNSTVNDTSENSYKTIQDEKEERSIFSAIDNEEKLMNIQEYCEYYGLDFEKVKNYKLISHSGTPFYNVVFYEEVIESSIDEETLKNLIEEGLQGITRQINTSPTEGKTGVVKIADLHLGAYVDNLIKTKDFSINILANKLMDAADEINERKYSIVHVHILGDLIESFTGLSHK